MALSGPKYFRLLVWGLELFLFLWISKIVYDIFILTRLPGNTGFENFMDFLILFLLFPLSYMSHARLHYIRALKTPRWEKIYIILSLLLVILLFIRFTPSVEDMEKACKYLRMVYFSGIAFEE